MNLSEHDKAVLEAIFDPLQLASFDPVDDTNEKNSLDDPNEVIEDPGVVELWKKAVSTAESGKIDEALDYFQQVREKAPNVLSVLNDRAQALRLAGRTEDAKEGPTEVDQCRFLNCPTKPLHIKEGQPPASIIQLQAECKNKTREIIYKIFYYNEEFCKIWFVHPYLSIDNKTGWINLTRPVDKSVLYYHKPSIEITVTAEGVEKGLRVFKLCSFEIYIDLSINRPPDVAHQFDTIMVDPLSDPFIVHRVVAYDSDEGDNARLKYSMIGRYPDRSIWPFTIDEDTGIIMAVGDLRHTKYNNYDLLITVTDKGSPPLSRTTSRYFKILSTPNKGAFQNK